MADDPQKEAINLSLNTREAYALFELLERALPTLSERDRDALQATRNNLYRLFD